MRGRTSGTPSCEFPIRAANSCTVRVNCPTNGITQERPNLRTRLARLPRRPLITPLILLAHLPAPSRRDPALLFATKIPRRTTAQFIVVVALSLAGPLRSLYHFRRLLENAVPMYCGERAERDPDGLARCRVQHLEVVGEGCRGGFVHGAGCKEVVEDGAFGGQVEGGKVVVPPGGGLVALLRGRKAVVSFWDGRGGEGRGVPA